MRKSIWEVWKRRINHLSDWWLHPFRRTPNSIYACSVVLERLLRQVHIGCLLEGWQWAQSQSDTPCKWKNYIQIWLHVFRPLEWRSSERDWSRHRFVSFHGSCIERHQWLICSVHAPEEEPISGSQWDQTLAVAIAIIGQAFPYWLLLLLVLFMRGSPGWSRLLEICSHKHRPITQQYHWYSYTVLNIFKIYISSF